MKMKIINLPPKTSYDKEYLLALSGVSWSKFEKIEAAFYDIAGVRFIYLDGVLEIMTLGKMVLTNPTT
jgi:hypothetical protein